MCTVVYRHSGERLILAMNRDERYGRASEIPPRIHEGPPRWLAPADGERGGTWIGVNDRGVAACLLNGYARGDLALLTQRGIPSRGGIIPDLLGSSNWNDVEYWIRHGLRAKSYPSFTLLVWDRNGGTRIRWRLDDGLSISALPMNAWAMESSSAWRTITVLDWRSRLFEQWIEGGESFAGRLPSFNVAEVSGRREMSPFMTRSFSATRSITLVDIDGAGKHAELAWWPRPGDGCITPDKPGSCQHIEFMTNEAA